MNSDPLRVPSPGDVFLVHHMHELDGREDVKLCGVFSSEANATEAIAALRTAPGFRNAPTAFSIDRYTLDRCEWREGFVTAS